MGYTDRVDIWTTQRNDMGYTDRVEIWTTQRVDDSRDSLSCMGATKAVMFILRKFKNK
jgi:hypothetical protein